MCHQARRHNERTDHLKPNTNTLTSMARPGETTSVLLPVYTDAGVDLFHSPRR